MTDNPPQHEQRDTYEPAISAGGYSLWLDPAGHPAFERPDSTRPGPGWERLYRKTGPS